MSYNVEDVYISNISPEARSVCEKFCLEQEKELKQDICGGDLWHYTNADALIKILDTKTLFATHVDCLNDSSERIYFYELLNECIKERKRARAGIPSDDIILYNALESALSIRNYLPISRFVTCFSESWDDLNQWRGYGGGECGYAIAFKASSFKHMTETMEDKKNISIVKMNYCQKLHKQISNDFIQTALECRRIDRDIYGRYPYNWANNIFSTLLALADMRFAAMKHKAFSSEQEVRLETTLDLMDKHNNAHLEFRQRHTLLACHFPIWSENERLPIVHIAVGPSPQPRVTVQNVERLLRKHDCTGVPVLPSAAPYRVP